MTWNPIATAPTGCSVLVFGRSNKYFAAPCDLVVARLSQRGEWFTVPGRYLIAPTHWMSLPDLPDFETPEIR